MKLSQNSCQPRGWLLNFFIVGLGRRASFLLIRLQLADLVDLHYFELDSLSMMCVQYRGGAQYRGGVQYRGGYHEYRGGYLEYRGGVQYRGGYLEYRGVYLEYRGVFSTVGDIMSTVGDVQYCGGYHDAHGGIP